MTEAIIDEAVDKDCNLVVSHHPLLFRGLKQVSDATDVQRTVRKAIKNDIVVVSLHTNLDNARGGVNFKIAERLGLQHVHFGHEPEDNVLSGSPAEKGQWVMGELPKPLEAIAFIAYVKNRMEASTAMCNELLQRSVSKIAICGGAGDFLLDEVIASGADAFITGEMHYHQYFGHEQEIQLCVIGHYESEHFTKELLRDIILRDCPDVRCEIAETNTNPILYL